MTAETLESLVTADFGVTAGWRVEQAHNGRVWQLRERGSRDNGRKRKTRYLGTLKKFSREAAKDYGDEKIAEADGAG